LIERARGGDRAVDNVKAKVPEKAVAKFRWAMLTQ